MGIFLVFVAVLFLLPLVLIFLKGVIGQSRDSLWDRNRKTARELASSALIDYMRTFSTDYNRDVFNSIFLNRNNPTFAGLGSSTSTLLSDPVRRTIFSSTRGRYKPGALDPRALGDKGLNGLFYFRSDLTRFDIYWNNPAMDMAANLDNDFCTGTGPSWVHSGSIWVGGNLRTIGCKPQFKEGVLVVNGTFETNPQTRIGPNQRVYCRKLTGSPSLVLPDASVVVYASTTNPANIGSNNPFFPDLAIAELDPGRNISYYLTRNSTEVVTTEDINLTFQANGELDIFFTVANTTSVFVLPSTATIVVSGSNVTVRGTVTKPTTLVVRTSGGGGDVRVDGNLTYLSGHAATAANALAVIAEGRLTFDSPFNQDVDGFFYSKAGQVTVLQNHALTIHGSLFGMIVISEMTTPSTQLTITPDTELIKHYPPYMARKPYVSNWDYVP